MLRSLSSSSGNVFLMGCALPQLKGQGAQKVKKAVGHALWTSALGMTTVEAAKWYLIKQFPANTALDDLAKQQVKTAYRNMGCDYQIRFGNAGLPFPATLTSLFSRRLMLFSCNQPITRQAYRELYAMAGHEAVHGKEHHEAISEFGSLMTFEFFRELGKLYQCRQALAFTGAFMCAALFYCQMMKAFEYRADKISAKKLHTERDLLAVFESHKHDDELSGFSHPSFEERADQLKGL